MNFFQANYLIKENEIKSKVLHLAASVPLADVMSMCMWESRLCVSSSGDVQLFSVKSNWCSKLQKLVPEPISSMCFWKKSLICGTWAGTVVSFKWNEKEETFEDPVKIGSILKSIFPMKNMVIDLQTWKDKLIAATEAMVVIYCSGDQHPPLEIEKEGVIACIRIIENQLWIGHSNGITRWNLDSLTRIDSLPSSRPSYKMIESPYFVYSVSSARDNTTITKWSKDGTQFSEFCRIDSKQLHLFGMRWIGSSMLITCYQTKGTWGCSLVATKPDGTVAEVVNVPGRTWCIEYSPEGGMLFVGCSSSLKVFQSKFGGLEANKNSSERLEYCKVVVDWVEEGAE